MLVFAAMPLMALEVSWGQFAALGPRQAWNCYPILGGNGLAGVMTSFLVTCYYNVLGAYALFYVAMALYSLKDIAHPIWSTCNNWWNTDHCQQLKENFTFEVGRPKSSHEFPAAEFWHNFVAEDSGRIDLFGYPHWKMVISLFVIWLISFAVVYKGVNSLGKAAYFFAIFPYICITFLSFAGAFQEGAAAGVMMYLVPNFERLRSVEVWTDAGQQIFFSLSVTQGSLITLSSFNNFKQDCFTNTVIVTIVNCVTSFWVGIPVFFVLGHMSYVTGLPIEEVVDKGPGLAFKAYPQALSLMPGASIWSVVFCFMLIPVALGSATCHVETVAAEFVDSCACLRKKNNELKFRGIIIVVFFLLGLPLICDGGFVLLDIVDSYSMGFNSYVIALVNLIGICYLYGYDNYEKDMTYMLGRKPSLYWKITWKYLAFILIIPVMILESHAKSAYKVGVAHWTVGLGWTITCSSLVFIPLYAFYVMFRDPAGISCAAYRRLTKPAPTWGFKTAEKGGSWSVNDGFTTAPVKIGRYSPSDNTVAA